MTTPDNKQEHPRVSKNPDYNYWQTAVAGTHYLVPVEMWDALLQERDRLQNDLSIARSDTVESTAK